MRASERVPGDLVWYGLLLSEDKYEWGARKILIWTGFIWDTERFKLFVPEVKPQRVESLIEELWSAKGEAVTVRKLAKLAGVLGSFTLGMGNCARFYTRAMLTQVAELAGKHAWMGVQRQAGGQSAHGVGILEEESEENKRVADEKLGGCHLL